MFGELWPQLGPPDAVVAACADADWCGGRFAEAADSLAAGVGATVAVEREALWAGHARWRALKVPRNLPAPFVPLDRFGQLAREWLRASVVRSIAPATRRIPLAACFAAWPEGVAVFRLTAAAASCALHCSGLALAGTETVLDPALWHAMRETIMEDPGWRRPSSGACSAVGRCGGTTPCCRRSLSRGRPRCAGRRARSAPAAAARPRSPHRGQNRGRSHARRWPA